MNTHRTLIPYNRKKKKSQSSSFRLRGELLEPRRLLSGLGVDLFSPGNSAVGIAVAAKVSVTFNAAIDPATLTSSTFQLRDSSNNVVPGRISYNDVNHAATLDANVPLDYFAAYTVALEGGASGVKDLAGDPLPNNLSWSFTTAASPQIGPGGPILIVTSASNPFSSYYAEILRAEGLNEFSTSDLTSVTSTTLADYQQVILGEMPLTSDQATMFSDWVQDGGNLIAMRPDSQLDELLGISLLSTTLSDAYLQVDTSSGPGAGVTDQTIQFHGTADSYSLAGATSVATLYTSATQATPSPAVTLRSVGSLGGQAAAFAYDLAKSIVYTRQGNPAWAGQERDGQTPIRPNDQFYGNAAGDPQPSWLDFNKVSIPQADEQQRLLANMITEMMVDKMPLPRLWYFPDGAKAVVMMTGDDHANGGTAGRFDTYLSNGTSGNQPIRSTSYIYPNTITNSQAAEYAAAGFEIGLHVAVLDNFGQPRNWTSFADLESIYAAELSTFLNIYPSLPTPATERTHAIVWSDYDSQPQVEFAHRIRLDANYYYYPASWIQDRPGMMTGSGMLMRFAKADGTMIDVYQAATQITDESGLTEPRTINALLDNALGSLEYYGVFTANMHTDATPSLSSEAIIASAKARGVPVMSAKDLLNWTDGRSGSSFGNLAWNEAAGIMEFSLTIAGGTAGLTAMLPYYQGNRALDNLTANGLPVPFTVQTVKGVTYAFFSATAGDYSASYVTDVQPPTIIGSQPQPAATPVSLTTQVTVTFSEPIDTGTLVFELRDSANHVVPANFTYAATNHEATLVPQFALFGATVYTVALSGVKDQFGNAMSDTSWSFTTATATVNQIVTENAYPGVNSSVWDIAGAGDSSLQGFATDISVGVGQTIDFKIDDPSLAQYHIEIYRMGYYGGDGARLITTIDSSQILKQAQPAPLSDAATGLIDCGNWAVSASWAVPENAVSGIYFARLERDDTGGASHITFIVRNDSGHSDLLFKTSDSTWQAYNDYGGNSLYVGGPGVDPGRAYKVSYNRPFNTRAVNNGLGSFNFVYHAEYPMVRWLESNGYDVSYFTDVDAARFGSEILEHKALLSVGHDEYWSAEERNNVEAARDAGVNLAFFSGNAVFKKTRWENSLDTSNTSYRTLVCYKDTHNNQQLDPVTTTGMWMDMRFGPPVSDGGRPQNALTGTLFMVNQGADYLGTSFNVPASYGDLRFWRNTSVASLAPGQTAVLGDKVLGYEWDADVDNGFRPAGLFGMSSTVQYVPEMLVDYGHTYRPGTVTHNLTLYRAASGALVFCAATVQWSWGLDGHHDNGVSSPVLAMQQATVNLFADMGVQPATLQPGLLPAVASTDTTKPTSTITSPSANLTVQRGIPVTITGTAADSSGGVVAGVEVSTDGGATWHPAVGRSTWAYTWKPDASGPVTILSRATDDSGNLEIPSAGVPVIVSGMSLWNSTVIPQVLEYANETSPIELGMKFRSDSAGLVTGVRFYKDWTNGGTHVGNLWTSDGQLLASVTFTNESVSGWQVANFSIPVAITASTTYIISYHTNVGHFSSDVGYFASSGADNGPLHALAQGVDGDNGVCAYGPAGTFPDQSLDSQNYWVDVIFALSNTVPPTVVNHAPASASIGVATTAALSATFSESVLSSSIHFTLRDPLNNVVPATLAYDDATHVATLTPNAPLSYSTVYTATLSDAIDTDGLVMTFPLSWSFTTIDVPGTQYSIWDTSATPNNVNWADPASMEMGVKFRSDLTGYITGIRFYKGTLNTGIHVGSLWTKTGVLLATATFQNETASGWQEISFDAPVQIAANTTYVVSYHTSAGYYSADNNFFAISGAGNGPLHALANGVDGGNGVYRYSSSSAFPDQTYLATNYWVDAIFTQTSDFTPPSVTIEQAASQTDPTNNSTIHFTATFSEPVLDFTAGDVTLSGTAGANSVLVTDSGDHQHFDLTVSGMTGDGTVIASLAAGVATDAEGNLSLASTSTDNTITYDITLPAVSAPDLVEAGDTGVSNTDNITKTTTPTFSGTAEPGASIVILEGLTILGTTTASITGEWTITSSLLDEGTHHIVARATDQAGNFQSSPSLTLLIDTTAPTITGTLDKTPAASGWYNIATGAPIYSYSASDAGSGLASPASGDYLFAEGANQSHTFTVTDTAGNSASVTNDPAINVDLTAPTITGTLDKTPAASGWYNIATGAPTYSYSASDAGSGLTSPASGDYLFAEGANQTHTFTVTDTAGNSASVTNDPAISVDLTAPTITGTLDKTPAASGWYNIATGAPTYSYTASDAGSGLTSPTSGDYLFAEGANQTHTFTVTDTAGNFAGVTNDPAINVDLTPPSATLEQAVSQADPANNSPIHFTVIFSEPVFDFTATNVALNGTAMPNSVLITDSGDHQTYDLAISGMTIDGTVLANLLAGAAHDTAGNLALPSSSTDNQVTYITTTHIWDGGGENNLWSTPANWVGDIAPLPGDNLVFPANATQFAIINDFAGVVFGSLVIAGGSYHIQNAPLNAGTIEVQQNATLTTASIIADSLIIGSPSTAASAVNSNTSKLVAPSKANASNPPRSLPTYSLPIATTIISTPMFAAATNDLPLAEESFTNNRIESSVLDGNSAPFQLAQAISLAVSTADPITIPTSSPLEIPLATKPLEQTGRPDYTPVQIFPTFNATPAAASPTPVSSYHLSNNPFNGESPLSSPQAMGYSPTATISKPHAHDLALQSILNESLDYFATKSDDFERLTVKGMKKPAPDILENMEDLLIQFTP